MAVGIADDIRGIGQSTLVRHQDRHRAGAEPARMPAMNERQMPLFAIVDSGEIQRPAGLLAEMTEREGYQTTFSRLRHGVMNAENFPTGMTSTWSQLVLHDLARAHDEFEMGAVGRQNADVLEWITVDDEQIRKRLGGDAAETSLEIHELGRE